MGHHPSTTRSPSQTTHLKEAENPLLGDMNVFGGIVKVKVGKAK